MYVVNVCSCFTKSVSEFSIYSYKLFHFLAKGKARAKRLKINKQNYFSLLFIFFFFFALSVCSDVLESFKKLMCLHCALLCVCVFF